MKSHAKKAIVNEFMDFTKSTKRNTDGKTHRSEEKTKLKVPYKRAKKVIYEE